MKLENVKVGETLFSPHNNLFDFKVVAVGEWEGEQLLKLSSTDKRTGSLWGYMVLVNDSVNYLTRWQE